MTPVVFLSPHLDDAVLSCAGRIQHHVEQGDPVVILTVFSHADPEDRAGWSARREEDRRAAAHLRAVPRWLGLADAPFRSTAERDPYALLGPLADEDADWPRWLAPRLHRELEQLEPRLLYVPLGVGDHVDHRLVYVAAKDLPFPRLHYEDRPYALVEHAVHRRLAALGCDASLGPPPPSTSIVEALTTAPYVEALLPAGPARERWTSHVATWPDTAATRSVHAELERLSVDRARNAEQAIWLYRSQVESLYGTRGRYRSLTRAYARALGHDAPAEERYWQGVA